MIRALLLLFALLAALAVGKVVLSPDGASPSMAIDAKVAELIADPARFDGKWVRVRAPVQERAALLGAGVVRIGDPSASVVVIGLVAPPPPGAMAEATGLFKIAAAFGGYQAPVLLVK